MSFLTVAQSAAIRLIGRKPTTFFSSTSTFELEITDLANEVARDVLEANDWRSLTKLHQMVGDGTTVGFDLPSDYDRMLVKGAVHSASWTTWTFEPARDLDFWRLLVNGLSASNPGFWIILDGEMQFQPPVASGETAQFYYISKNVVRSESGSLKETFTADSDSFVLNERLLTLGLIWMWRAQKRLEYAEDLANYEKAKEEAVTPDKGSRMIAVGQATWPGGTATAYPFKLGS